MIILDILSPVKTLVERNPRRTAIVGGIATSLAAAYFYGKSKGNITVKVVLRADQNLEDILGTVPFKR